MKQRYFITATGTDAGKTYLTTRLITACRNLEKSVTAVKPVISGWSQNDPHSDTALFLQALGQPLTPHYIDMISPWRFAAPIAPNLAAERQNTSIDFTQLITFSQTPPTCCDYFFIEGVGGVMAPITYHHTVLDWIDALDITTILISGTYLGAMSHCLTALLALQSKGIKIACIILNETANSTVPLQDTMKALQTFCHVPIYPLQYDASASSTSFLTITDTLFSS